LSSASVSHYWFGDPTVPLAVASAVWFSLDGRCRLRLNKPTINSALRVYLPLECYPANPSRRVATRQLLSWALRPYSTCEIEGPHDASRAGPALFRLQGLVTLLAAYSLRSLAGFLSRRQRSWDSPFEAFSSRRSTRAFPLECTHVPFRSHAHEVQAQSRHGRRGFWVLTFLRVPGGSHVFSTQTAGCSRGFHTFQGLEANALTGVSPDLLSRAFQAQA
jgi:hypothetical protein